MSPPDVPPDEMGSRSHHDDELDRLLEAASAGDPGELPRFIDEVRTAYPAGSLTSEDLHVAAMLDASHLAEKGDPVVRPVSNAGAPDQQASRLPKRKGNHVRDKKLRPILKVLAPVFALLMLFSGMAFAGVLPTPLGDSQTDVSVDDGEIDDDVDVDDETDTDDDAQGEDGDHQGEDEDGDADDDDADHDDEDADHDEDEDSDDQGEDGDHQGEDEDGDADHDEDEDEDADEDSDDDADEDDDEDEDEDHSGSDDDSDEDDDEQD